VFEVLDGLTGLRDGAEVQVERLTHRPAWAEAADNPVANELIERATALGFEIGRGVSGGAGDTNHVGHSGVPTVDGLGPDGGGAHSPGEHASLRSLLERAVLLSDYLAPHPPERNHD
jgi:glutamate carboxypeptidase